MRKKGISELLPALTVPIMLILSVAVFHGMQDAGQSTWEVAYNESITFASNTTYTAVGNAPIVEDNGVVIRNYTHTFPASATSVNSVEANYSFTSEGVLMRTNETFTLGTYNVSYTGHGGNGWSSFESIRDRTYSGYQLGSLLPYVIVAVLVIGALLGIAIFR